MSLNGPLPGKIEKRGISRKSSKIGQSKLPETVKLLGNSRSVMKYIYGVGLMSSNP
jgi:hypothetical protein